MRKLLRAVFVCITLLGAVLAISTPSKASSGAWLVVCGYTRSLPDDPIVKPGQPGASHLHDFFGNTGVDAGSTFRSMTAASSTCPAGDRAGYWAPALYRNGKKVNPAGSGVREQVYYTADNLASGTHIEPFPPDLRIVAGNAHATNARENPTLGEEIYWGCSDNSVGGKPLSPPGSCRTGILSLHIGFPNCWDGKLTHVDDTAHLRHPVGARCPAGFPHALPRVIMRTEYPVGTSTGTITLASGAPFTAHADFWNTWDQAKLTSLVNNCLNADKDCGTFRGTTSGGTGGSGGGGSGGGSSPTTTAGGGTTTTQTTHHQHHTATTIAAGGAASQSHANEQAAGSTTSTSTTMAAQAGAGADEATTESTGGTAAAAARSELGGGNSLPFTGAPMTGAAVVAFGLLGLGATTLIRTRTPRPRPKH